MEMFDFSIFLVVKDCQMRHFVSKSKRPGSKRDNSTHPESSHLLQNKTTLRSLCPSTKYSCENPRSQKDPLQASCRRTNKSGLVTESNLYVFYGPQPSIPTCAAHNPNTTCVMHRIWHQLKQVGSEASMFSMCCRPAAKAHLSLCHSSKTHSIN